VTHPHSRSELDPIEEAIRQWKKHGWSNSAEGMAAITSLMRAQQIAIARVETILKKFGITFSRYELLMLLQFSSRGSLPMSVITSRLQVHATSVTNTVDRLEKALLVARLPHPSDRRATLVEITDTGRALADSATQELNEYVFSKPGLSPQDMSNLIRILTAYREAAGDFSHESNR